MPLKLTSWNVNGIRACQKAGFEDFLIGSQSDIFCVQEIKANEDQVALKLPPGWHAIWNSALRKGYSGTAIFTRIAPEKVSFGIGDAEGDSEGRVINAEFEDFILVNVYTPNSKRLLERLSYRHQIWDRAFLKHLQFLENRKPVIFCGDLNVAHTEDDLARPGDNRRNAGFTDEERESFQNIMNAGFIDTFREYVQGNGHYTWWSYMNQARPRNIGWRIDYWCISPKLRSRLAAAKIHPEIVGSDHCPVSMVLDG